jgi:hypothetical protein
MKIKSNYMSLITKDIKVIMPRGVSARRKTQYIYKNYREREKMMSMKKEEDE